MIFKGSDLREILIFELFFISSMLVLARQILNSGKVQTTKIIVWPVKSIVPGMNATSNFVPGASQKNRLISTTVVYLFSTRANDGKLFALNYLNRFYHSFI